MPRSAFAPGLWSDQVSPATYGSPEQYYEHMFEQYKLYVHSAEEISARRNLANTFFLTLNTLLLGLIGFSYDKVQQLAHPEILIVPAIVCVMLCMLWGRLLLSYKQLNEAKYMVIGEFECRLPTSPYWRAEWYLLSEGPKSRRYKMLSDTERWVPRIFTALYSLISIALLLLSLGIL